MKFKPGDKVRCINPGGTTYLTLDKVYVVTKVDVDGGVEVINNTDMSGHYCKTRFELVSSDDVCNTDMLQEPDLGYIAENLDFIEAIRQLGMGHRLGLAGTDWSWYYKWGVRNDEVILVKEDGSPAVLSYNDYVTNDWIIDDRDKGE